MRVATIFAGVPNPWQSGATLQHWALLSALRSAGHDVVVISLPWESDHEDEARLEAVRRLGAELRVVEPEPPGPARGRRRARVAYLRTLLWPDDEALFPAVAHERAALAVLADEKPDAVLAHGTPAIAASSQAPLPKLALAGDPPGTSRRIRAQWDPPDALLQRLGTWTYARRADARIYALLRRYDSVGIFGAHYADLAKRHGVAAWYAPSPVEDPLPSRARVTHEGVPRILLIGHLRGIATISGLHVLVKDVLPLLDSELGRSGYEARVVGAYDPPESLREALRHPAVKLTGAVEPPDEEFLGADVVLVPTPIETGPRVRVLTAFAYRCCVVAHRANALGIPELADGENTLLTDTEGLASATLRALRDPGLRERLGVAGRALYEARFTPEAAGGRIVRELEELASSVQISTRSRSSRAGE